MGHTLWWMGCLEAAALSEELPPEPASAARARRLVADALVATGHAALVDVATLLVSEVVTNAVLHAGTPIGVSCSWSGPCFRVEVQDGSAVLPAVRHYEREATTGRGVGLVAALADRWGVDTDAEGKTLWFELGAEADAGAGAAAAPVAGGDEDVTAPAPAPGVTVHLLDAAPALVLAAVQYGDAVLRELALLSLGGELEELMPEGWRLPQFDVAPILDAAGAARAAGRVRADLVLELPADATATSLERMRLIDRADGLARQRQLLVLPALPEVGACRHWLYTQIHEQSAGAPPERWRLPDPLEPAQVAAAIAPEELASVLAAPVPTVVADDANRIIHVNDAAAELLGWDTDALLGQRLTVVIPPELREAHLAGFSRLLITGEPRLLDQPVEVTALRRDGSRVDVVLTIRAVPGGAGRRAFRASLEERSS